MKRLLSLALLAGAGFCAWRYLQDKPRPAARRLPLLPDDELLTRRVMVSIRQAGALPPHLHLRVLDGTVLLAGSVTPAERDRILRAILAAPGIRGVRNGLAVESGPWEPSPNAP